MRNLLLELLKLRFLQVCGAFVLAFFRIADATDNIDMEKLEFIHVKEMQTDENRGIAGLKSSFLASLQKLFHIDTFIESGTYLGDTTENASHIFSEVHTIELAPELFVKAKNRFSNSKNVTVHFGDSGKVLPNILKNKCGKILFFLDGHFSKRNTAKGDKNTPISDEIEAILQSGIRDCVLIVDDVRFFQVALNPELAIQDYPSLLELLNNCRKINPDYCIAIIGDLAIIYSKQESIKLSPVVEACTASRLHYEIPLSKSELNRFEIIIGHAKNEELKCIEMMYNAYSKGEIRNGLRSFSSLWYALTLLQKNEKAEALEILTETARNSPQDWQIFDVLNEIQID